MINFDSTPTSLVQPYPHVWWGDPALGLDQEVPLLDPDATDEQREEFEKLRLAWEQKTGKDYQTEVDRWEAYRQAIETGELAELGVGGERPTVFWLRPGLGKLPEYVRGLLTVSQARPQLHLVNVYRIASAVIQRVEHATGIELRWAEGEVGPVLADETMAVLRKADGLLMDIAARAVRAYEISPK